VVKLSAGLNISQYWINLAAAVAQAFMACKISSAAWRFSSQGNCSLVIAKFVPQFKNQTLGCFFANSRTLQDFFITADDS
jgi:hypothetical protein